MKEIKEKIIFTITFTAMLSFSPPQHRNKKRESMGRAVLSVRDIIVSIIRDLCGELNTENHHFPHHTNGIPN